MFYILHLKCLLFCLHQFQRKHRIFKSIAYGGQKCTEQNKLIKNKLRTVRSKLKLRENPSPLSVRENGEATPLQYRPLGKLQDNQLPVGCDWAAPLCGWLSSVLWFNVVVVLLDRAEAARVAEEEELTPLEVLTELCWMASFWGLPGTDISSQLSSLSETALGKDKKVTAEGACAIYVWEFLLH